MMQGKSITNELELEMKNKSNDIIQSAMAQKELREKFKEMKQKDIDELIRDLNERK